MGKTIPESREFPFLIKLCLLPNLIERKLIKSTKIL